MNIDSAPPSSSRPSSPTETLQQKNQVPEKSVNKDEPSTSGAVGGSQITHRKAAEAVCQRPLSHPEPKVDEQWVMLGEALLDIDKKRHFIRTEKGLRKKAIEQLRQEDPELFGRLDEQFEPDIPLQFRAMMDLDNLLENSGLTKKNQRKSKARATSLVCKEAQKAENKIRKKAVDKAVGYGTHYLLDDMWLGKVKEKASSGQLDQALCDVNELLRVCRKLKTPHSFLPDLESQALRTKISLSTKLGHWIDVISSLEVMACRYPEQSFTKDTLFLATIYLSRVLHGSIEHDLKAHFSPEKAFSCIMRFLPCEEVKSKEFYQAFPEYRYFLDGLIDLKSNSGRRTHELLNLCTKALNDCKEPSGMFDFSVLPALSAHMHINNGNADLAINAIKEIKDISPTLTRYYMARLSQLKKEKHTALLFYKSLVSRGVPVYKELFDIFIKRKDFKLVVVTAFAAEHFYSKNNCVREASYWGLLAEEYDRQEKADSAIEAQKLKAEKQSKAETHTHEKSEEDIPESQRGSSTSKEREKVDSKQSLTLEGDKPQSTKPAQEQQSVERHYYQVQSMIRKYKYKSDSRSDITEDDITDKFKTALSEHSGDLWLLHSSGWWNFEQNNNIKLRVICSKVYKLPWVEPPIGKYQIQVKSKELS